MKLINKALIKKITDSRKYSKFGRLHIKDAMHLDHNDSHQAIDNFQSFCIQNRCPIQMKGISSINKSILRHFQHSNLDNKSENKCNDDKKKVKKVVQPEINLERKKNFNPYITAFKSEYFVDKTDFIAEVLKLDPNTNHLICGPLRWGKSTNLRMLEMFFEAPNHEKSKLQDQSSNPNRKFFEGTKIFKDHPQLFDQHFGKYPVLYFDFSNVKCLTPARFETALFGATNTIKIKYKKMFEGTKIKSSFMEFAKHLTQEKETIFTFLINLCALLEDVYERPPILLFDECDEPIRYLIQKCKNEDDYEAVIDIFNDFYLTLLKTNTSREYVIMTGITRLSKATVISPSIIKDHQLVAGQFANFYSFTKSDVDYLLKKFNYSSKNFDNLSELLNEMYNGYNINNHKIYNCFSILNALTYIKTICPNDTKFNIEQIKKGLLPYWYNTYKLDSLKSIFRSWICYSLIKRLLTEKFIKSPLLFMNEVDY